MTEPLRSTTRLRPDDERIHECVHLHIAALPQTLSSQRGDRALDGIYRRLIRQGHAVYAASVDGHVTGGLVVIKHGVPSRPLALILYRPWSWLCAVRRLGLRDLLGQFVDLISVRLVTRQLSTHDYILALYVSEDVRRMGIARLLVDAARADAVKRGVALAVDTTLTNFVAQAFYADHGFQAFKRTARSVVFTSGLE
jgi:ribosomal protein S18 acetylase RimI-like enzyme